MYDINKFIANDRLQYKDPEGNMVGLAHWSPLVANKVAEQEGITMTEEHWQIIYCLRERFREMGPEWTARQLTHELERDYSASGGRRFLYELFPHGPITQGCRIAGLPLPQGTLSLSFGSVH